MILSFKPQFVEPILNSTKTHSIRDDKTNRWHVGISIQMATGVRTKNYNCFKVCECKTIQKIHIYCDVKYLRIYVDGRILDQNETCTLIQNDGFFCIADFKKWFFPKTGSGFYVGKIIHWTDLKY